MNCSKCGAQLSEGSAFCTSCGAALNEETQVLENAFVQSENVGAQSVAEATAPKKKNLNKIIIPIVVAVVAVFVIIAAVVIIKLTSSPFVKINKAFKNLVNSGDTYNVELEAGEGSKKIEYGVKCSADLKMDLKNGYLAFDDIMYKEVYDSETSDKIKGADVKGFIDAKNSEMGVIVKLKEHEVEMYAYNRTLMLNIEDEKEYTCFLNEKHYHDVMVVLANAMSLAAGEDVDEKAVVASVEDLIKPILDMYDIELEGDFLQVIPQEHLDALESKLIKCISDEKWLEENLDYTEEKNGDETVYSFKISYKTVKALKEAAKSEILLIAEDVLKYVNEMDFADELNLDLDKDDIEEGIDELIDMMKEEKISFKIEFGVVKNVLSRVEIKGEDIIVKINFAKTDDIKFTSPDFNKYETECLKNGQEEDALDFFVSVVNGNANRKVCDTNIKTIKTCAANYYASYNRVATVNDLANMMDAGNLPVCPNGGKYEITINSNGSASVYCPYHSTPEVAYYPGYDSSYGYSDYEVVTEIINASDYYDDYDD